MVLLVDNNHTPFNNRMSHKSLREKERRDEINNKINELRQFVCQDENDRKTLKQADVLQRTVELVHRMERETPGPSLVPERKGFADGFGFAEIESFNYVKNLGVSASVCEEYVENIKQLLDNKRNELFLSHLHTSPLSKTGPIRSKQSPEYNSSPYAVDRKEIKKNREQDRRDRQGESIEALKHFLISIESSSLNNKYQVEKLQRLSILERIIKYIKNKKNNFVGSNTEETNMYRKSFNEGFKTAKLTVMDFFKKNRPLQEKTAYLEEHLETAKRTRYPSILATPPAPMFPAFQPICPMPFVRFVPCPPVPFFNPFFQQNHQQQQQQPRVPSPAYSLESPPPLSDTSSSSIDSSTTDSSSTSPSNLWRPWV